MGCSEERGSMWLEGGTWESGTGGARGIEKPRHTHRALEAEALGYIQEPCRTTGELLSRRVIWPNLGFKKNTPII